jgi:predicted ATPase/class 3 adenylate cyclase
MSAPLSTSDLSSGENSLTPADVERLQPYLRAALLNELRRVLLAPPLPLLERCSAQLARLLDITASHLPAYLVAQVAQDPRPGRTGGRFVEGALLFADVSGFTAMSEKLSRTGREGAEEISSIINHYFGVMLALLRESGGQLLKFGGDALLGLFLEPGSALRATQAALRMQAAMAEFAQTRTSQGIFPLRMKVGLHRGRFFAVQLGTEQGMENAVFGTDVNATAAAESAAVAGQVLMDRPTREALGAPSRATPVAEPYYVIEAVDAPPQSVASGATPLADAAAPSISGLRRAAALLDAFVPYLPIGLLGRLAGDTHALALEGEHRIVSVMFANVHGLGEIVDRLGAEGGKEAPITEALNRYYVAMQKAIHSFGGVANKIDLYDRGDKLLAFFGAPLAHEDDAERAARAALDMQAALRELSTMLPAEVGLPDLQLHQHIGLSYGSVFAGYIGTSWRHEYTVMGDEVNLAARLMTVAGAGDVIISQGVRRKVKALFDLTPRGEVKLKGKSEPIPTFAVDGARARPEQAGGVEGMRSPVVGRQAEWAALTAVVESTMVGRGGILSVVGEAGMGKSRLVSELREQYTRGSQPAVRWYEGRCLSYTASVSYLPFLELLRQLTGVQADDGEKEAWLKLRQAATQWLSPADAREELPYLANFLGLALDADDHESIRYLDAEALQKRTFVALRELIRAAARARAQPLTLVLDDIQWLDEASHKLLAYLLPLVEQTPLLLILIYRPEPASESARLGETIQREFGGRATTVTLSGLSLADSQTLLANLVPLENWPLEMQSLVLGRTEGNPLYIEEVLRALVDSGALLRGEQGRWQINPTLMNMEVPDTLQGVMMTRLDRLEEPSRRTAQVGAVVGRTFPLDVLAHVTDEPQQQLSAYLLNLEQHEIVTEDARTSELDYAFRHGLMQEVSYNSLLARTRRAHHRKIAAYLESNLSDLENGDALIAHHAFAGQDWPRALKYQRRAGQQSQKLFANKDAIDHFLKALQSAGPLPPEETAAERLTLHAALGELFAIGAQYEAAAQHLEQARALAQGNADMEARVCRWQAKLNELRGDYPAALEWVGRTLEVLEGGETAEAAEALLLAGLIKTRQGEKAEALERCQQALGIAEKLGEVAVLARAHNLLGVINFMRGDYEAATEDCQRAVELYQRAGHIHGQALAYNTLANAQFGMGRWQEADRYYRQAHDTFDQVGDVNNRIFVDNNLGGIALNQGRLEDALAFYRAALRAVEQTAGSAYVRGALHNNLGATYVRQGNAAAAREHLRASQPLFDQVQARDFLPEMHRHFAEAALIAGDLAEAEAEGQQALSLARELAMRGEEGNSLRVLGEIAAARSQWVLTEKLLGQSMAVLDEVGEKYEAARSRLSLAKACAALHQPERARAALAECEPVFQHLDAALDLQTVRALRTALADL